MGKIYTALLLLDIAITEVILFQFDYSIGTKILLTPAIMIPVLAGEIGIAILASCFIGSKKEIATMEETKIEEKEVVTEKIPTEDLVGELRKEKERLVQEGVFIDNSFKIPTLRKTIN